MKEDNTQSYCDSRNVNQVRLTCLIRLLKRALRADRAKRGQGHASKPPPLEQSAATYRNEKQRREEGVHTGQGPGPASCSALAPMGATS